MLFYIIIITTFAHAFARQIINKFLYCLMYSSSSSKRSHKDALAEMSKELSGISMTDEWAKYAKLQRKINKETDLLEKLNKDESDQLSGFHSNGVFYLRLVIGLILAQMLWSHLSDIVTQVDENTIWPLAWRICWSDVPGGITVPAWIIISSSAAKAFAKSVG